MGLCKYWGKHESALSWSVIRGQPVSESVGELVG